MSIGSYEMSLVSNALGRISDALTEPIENISDSAAIDLTHRVSIAFGLCEIAKSIHHLAEALEKAR